MQAIKNGAKIATNDKRMFRIVRLILISTLAIVGLAIWGTHQFQSPKSRISAGAINIRTIVTSMNIASAKPNPTDFTVTTSANTKLAPDND